MSETDSKFGKKGWGIVLFVLVLYLFSSAPVDLLNVSVGAFSQMKGWSQETLLSFSSVGGWIGVLLSLLFGQWVAVKGVKVPTVVGLIVLGLFFILNGQASSIPMYAVAAIGMAAVSGCINLVATNTFMSNWFPKKKGIALGWATMGMPISSAICVPIFGMLLGLASGNIAIPFLVFGILIILVAIFTAVKIKATPEEADAYPDNEIISAAEVAANKERLNSYTSAWTVKRLLGCKQMWIVSLTFGLLFIALMSTMTQFVPRLTSSGFTQSEAVMWLTIASVLGIPGSYLWGLLDQKTSTKTATVVFAVYMMAMQFLSALFIGNKIVSTVLIALIGILIGGIGNLFPSMVIQIFGRYDFAAANRVVVPLVTAIRTSSFIIMALILGATHGNYGILCTVLGVFSAVAVVLSLLLSNRTISAEAKKAAV